MGGNGEHRGEYAVWVHCYRLGGGRGDAGVTSQPSAGGGALDCSRPAQWAACANRALGDLSGAR